MESPANEGSAPGIHVPQNMYGVSREALTEAERRLEAERVADNKLKMKCCCMRVYKR